MRKVKIKIVEIRKNIWSILIYNKMNKLVLISGTFRDRYSADRSATRIIEAIQSREYLLLS